MSEVNFWIKKIEVKKSPIHGWGVFASETINKGEYDSLNDSPLNYNKYAWSLMKDKDFVKKHNKMMSAVNPKNK